MNTIHVACVDCIGDLWLETDGDPAQEAFARGWAIGSDGRWRCPKCKAEAETPEYKAAMEEVK